jgi:CBS domain-containing protein
MKRIMKKNRSVADLMTPMVYACHEGDPASRAAQLMWEHDCGFIPVMDTDGRPIGVVTDRDVCMAAYTRNQAPQAIEVRDLMTKELITCSPRDSLEDAEKRMQGHQIRRLPVVEDGRLVGVLSLNDISLATDGRGASPEDVAETLAAIGRHRHPSSEAARPPHG